MILGQINFGHSGKFDYEIQTESLKKASEAVAKFVMETDEKEVVEYLSQSNRSALERLRRLIEAAKAKQGSVCVKCIYADNGKPQAREVACMDCIHSEGPTSDNFVEDNNG
jgi:CHASE3 domain sensor protein